MAFVVRRILTTYCHARAVQNMAPLWKCQYSTKTFEMEVNGSGPRYYGRRSKHHQWLEKTKQAMIEAKNFDFSPSSIEELEEEFNEEAEGRGNIMHFDLVLMTFLSKEQKAREGFQLMKYIRKRREPSLLVLIAYMLCCHVEYPKVILEEYKTLKESLDLCTVNISTMCALAKVAARTSLWRDAYEYLDLIQQEVECGESQMTLDTAVASVLVSGIHTSNFELLLELEFKHPRWFHCGMKRGIVTPALFHTWKAEKIHLDVFLQLLKDFGQNLNLRDTQAEEIQTVCKSKLADKIECELTEVNPDSAVCRHCSQQFPFHALTADEFDLLKKTVFEKLVYGRNIFENTTPESIAKFLAFMRERGDNYDIVIDGPNVYYGRDIYFWDTLTGMVADIKDNLQLKSPRILLLADIHRFKNFYNCPRHLKEYVDIYTVDYKKSHDDIFMLVAACMSGRDTYFITNDNLRNHRSKLGDSCYNLFSKWQKQKQILHDFSQLQFPQTYDSGTFLTEDGWHVPYEDDAREQTNAKVKAYFKDTRKFLCVRKLRPFKSAQLKAYSRMREEFQQKYADNPTNVESMNE